MGKITDSPVQPGLIVVSKNLPQNEISSDSEQRISRILRHLGLEAGDLEESLAKLSSRQRQYFHEAVPTTLWQDLKALSREADPELLLEGLLNLANRAEAYDNPGFAVSVYNDLAEEKDYPEIQKKAAERLAVLSGKGSLGAKSEFILSRTLKQICDPADLIAMSVGFGALRGIRYLTAGRLMQAQRAARLPGLNSKEIYRILAANPTVERLSPLYSGLATATGLGLGSAGYTVAEKGTKELLDRPQDWSTSTLSQEIAVNTLNFGGMYAAGAVGKGLAKRFGAGTAMETAYISVGLAGGSMHSASLSEWMGLSPPTYAGNLPDGLANMLHFWLARGLTGKAFGKTFRSREAGMLGGGLLAKMPAR
ncbi:MAG TPA: hypothetical protein VFW62_08160 [bacterium]|nr:hypothetical protein [bacterium]